MNQTEIENLSPLRKLRSKNIKTKKKTYKYKGRNIKL